MSDPDSPPRRSSARSPATTTPGTPTTSTRSWPCTRPTWCSRTTPPHERAEGEAVREHIGSIFETWPDIRFEGRRTYCRDGLVVQEWTATATHANEMRRGDLVAEPTGKTITWDGLDVIPFEDGLVKRKDVYSDSVSILRQLGLL